MPPPAAAAVAAPPLKIDSAAAKLNAEARKPPHAEDSPATGEIPFEHVLKRARSKPEGTAADDVSAVQQAPANAPRSSEAKEETGATLQVEEEVESKDAADDPRTCARCCDSETTGSSEPDQVALPLVAQQQIEDVPAPIELVAEEQSLKNSAGAVSASIETVTPAAAVVAPAEDANPAITPGDAATRRNPGEATNALEPNDATDTEASPQPTRVAADVKRGISDRVAARDISKPEQSALPVADASSEAFDATDDQSPEQPPLKHSPQPKPFDTDDRQDSSGVRNVAPSVETSESATKGASPHPTPTSGSHSIESLGASLGKSVAPAPGESSQPAPSPATNTPLTPREIEFTQANHERLVTAIHAQLLPRGGTMQIRLDPPQLGTLQVAVEMLDGVMNVSFQTSNEEATRLLSHSLAQLKHVLEARGVSVDKLHVQQAPKSESSSSNQSNDENLQQRHDPQEESFARQEQQRKEMLRRMWRRLAMGSDPLDLVA